MVAEARGGECLAFVDPKSQHGEMLIKGDRLILDVTESMKLRLTHLHTERDLHRERAATTLELIRRALLPEVDRTQRRERMLTARAPALA